MQCVAFCSADSYEMNLLYKFLIKEFNTPNKYRDVYHVQWEGSDIFFFNYGCAVFWGVEEELIDKILRKLKNFENEHFVKPNFYSYFVVQGPTNKVYQNEIILNEASGIMEKLAISFALAQSMKLSVFEEKIEHTIKKTEHIPKSLAISGKITLSGKQIAQKMGKLFLERSSINLHSDILDTPDFFWDYPELEPLYRMTAKDQDIKQRVEILNKRLNLIHELFEMLSDVFNNRHSSILEIIIIILISMEIILTIAFKIFK